MAMFQSNRLKIKHTNISHARFARARLPIRHSLPSPDSAIYTPFLVAFASHMCPVKEAVSYCLENQMIIPPYKEQVEIVTAMRQIYEYIDFNGTQLDHIIFKLLLTHDVEKLNELLNLLLQYNQIENQIAHMINN